jgi:hypothetical protein
VSTVYTALVQREKLYCQRDLSRLPLISCVIMMREMSGRRIM